MWNQVVRNDTWVMNLPNGVLVRTKTKEEIGRYSSTYGSLAMSESMQFIPDIYWDVEAKVFMPIEALPENHSTKVDENV